MARGHTIDLRDGTYVMSYVASDVGEAQLSIRSGREHVQGSPFSVKVHPGPDGSKSRAYGDGLEGSVVGLRSTIVVELSDANGIGLRAIGYPVSIKIRPTRAVASAARELKSTHLSQRADADSAEPAGRDEGSLIQQDDGTYLASYAMYESGPHEIAVFAVGQEVAGSPFIVNVTSSNAAALTSIAEGPGLKSTYIGMRTTVTVRSRDRYGNNVTVGGAPFEAAFSEGLDDPMPTAAEVTDLHDGRYAVMYKPTAIGRSLLTISLHNEQIRGSPFRVIVKTGLDIGLCKVSGDGTRTAVAGKPANFTVHTFDAGGSAITQVSPAYTSVRVHVRVHECMMCAGWIQLQWSSA